MHSTFGLIDCLQGLALGEMSLMPLSLGYRNCDMDTSAFCALLQVTNCAALAPVLVLVSPCARLLAAHPAAKALQGQRTLGVPVGCAHSACGTALGQALEYLPRLWRARFLIG